MERRPGGENTGPDHPGRPPCHEDGPGGPLVCPTRAGRAGGIPFLGQPHRGLPPFDADIGHGHPAAVVGSLSTDMARLQGPERDRLDRPKRPIVDIAGARVEPGRVVDCQDRRGGGHPCHHLGREPAPGSTTEQRIDDEVRLGHGSQISNSHATVPCQGRRPHCLGSTGRGQGVHFDCCTATPQIPGSDVTVPAVVARARQHHHPLAVPGAETGRGQRDGESGPVHRLVHVAGVGLVDPPVLLGGEDRLHGRRGYIRLDDAPRRPCLAGHHERSRRQVSAAELAESRPRGQVERGGKISGRAHPQGEGLPPLVE